MGDRERLNVYFNMFNEAQILEKQIRDALQLLNVRIYTVYVAVGDEEKRQFFVDIEYGGSPEKYRRYKGLYTKEQLSQRFLRSRRKDDENYKHTSI